MAHALSIAHALSNTVSALGQGFALATARCVYCQCMMLVEGVAHASLKTFGHFALSCGCEVASRLGYQTILDQALYAGPPPPKKKKKIILGKNKSLRMS
jgi:hypothetical protein